MNPVSLAGFHVWEISGTRFLAREKGQCEGPCSYPSVPLGREPTVGVEEVKMPVLSQCLSVRLGSPELPRRALLGSPLASFSPF